MFLIHTWFCSVLFLFAVSWHSVPQQLVSFSKKASIGDPHQVSSHLEANQIRRGKHFIVPLAFQHRPRGLSKLSGGLAFTGPPPVERFSCFGDAYVV